MLSMAMLFRSRSCVSSLWPMLARLDDTLSAAPRCNARCGHGGTERYPPLHRYKTQVTHIEYRREAGSEATKLLTYADTLSLSLNERSLTHLLRRGDVDDGYIGRE